MIPPLLAPSNVVATLRVPFANAANSLRVASAKGDRNDPAARSRSTVDRSQPPPGETPAPCRPFAEAGRRRDRLAFTLIEILVLIAIIAVLLSLLLPAVQQAREAARRSHCKNNLKQMGLGLHNYHELHQGLPPGYIRSHGTGWSAFLLPYLEQETLYDSLVWGAAWDADGPNRVACETVIPFYRCPSASMPDHENNAGIPMRAPANYVGCATGTEPHDVGTGSDGFDDPDEDGLLMENVSIPLRSVRDGTSVTVLIGETLHTSHDGRDHWAVGSPDIDAGRDNSEFLASTAVPINSVDEEAFRSEHDGGCYFLMADGRVRFVSETVDVDVLSALGTRSGREVVNEF